MPLSKLALIVLFALGAMVGGRRGLRGQWREVLGIALGVAAAAAFCWIVGDMKADGETFRGLFGVIMGVFLGVAVAGTLLGGLGGILIRRYRGQRAEALAPISGFQVDLILIAVIAIGAVILSLLE